MVEMALQAARRAQESTYDGVATVVEYQKVRDEASKLTSMQEVVVIEKEPCRLSFASDTTVSQSESAASMTQSVKLFLSPDIQIKPGSKIIVTQCKTTTAYTYSGVPAVYPTHQEIQVELFERWS